MNTEKLDIARNLWIRISEFPPPNSEKWFVLLDDKSGRTEICRWFYVNRPVHSETDLRYVREDVPSRLVTRYGVSLDCDFESFSHWLPAPFEGRK